MKHMKRALSLVLAMIMLLGMMAIPTGAVSNFADEAEITYDEAVEVTSGLGLFAGSGGKFLPKDTVTRAQMATIIVKMLHGSEVNADSFKGISGGFTDIAAFEGGWAEGYINWCASLGVVAGYGDGTFRPGQAVTTAEAATMILNALKVDAGEGQWPLTVMAKAEELKMFKGLSPKPDTNEALTREELAVVALHGLEYSPSNKVGYTYNGVTYNSYIEAYLVAGPENAADIKSAKEDSLANRVFGLNSATGFIIGNQAIGLEYTLLSNGEAEFKFDLETDLDAIGHYVTVYYKDQYVSQSKPGVAYTVFDESTVVEVAEKITNGQDFRAAFGSGNVKLSTAEACSIASDYTVEGCGTTGLVINGDGGFDPSGNVAAAGTYILSGNTVMAYIAPVQVYASIVDGIEAYKGEESVILRGVSNPIPNAEDNDLVDEFVGMKVGDCVTYTKVGDRYVLERVRVVSGKVTALSTTGEDRPVVSVDGVAYVQFDAEANYTGLTYNVDALNFTDTFNFYTTRDGKFVGFKTIEEEGIKVDDVVYILGTFKTVKKDSYGAQVIHYMARGVDLNGVETLIPVALVEDANRNGVADEGEDILGDAAIVRGEKTYSKIVNEDVETGCFYAVKDHADSDARQAGIRELVAFGDTYDKQTSPLFVLPYMLRGLVFGGQGSFGPDKNNPDCYAYTQAGSKYMMMAGSADQGTALQATVQTGPCSISMEENNVLWADALLSRSETGGYVVEAMMIHTKAVATVVSSETIYVAQNANTYSARVTAGYIYDVYAAATGKATQITLATGDELEPGFYQVSFNQETKQHELLTLVVKGGTSEGYINGTEDKLASLTAASADDGVSGVAVCYDIPFDYMAGNYMFAGGIWNANAAGVVVVDTRTQAQIVGSRIAAITSIDRVSSLKLTNENLSILIDIYFDSNSDKLTAIYIKEVVDYTSDSRGGSLLVSGADTDSFLVLHSTDPDELPEGEIYEPEDVFIQCDNGSGCTHEMGIFQLLSADSTGTKISLKHLSTADGEGTLGLHNAVIRADGDNWVLIDAHHNSYTTIENCTSGAVCWNKETGAEASMVLDVSNADIPVYDMAGTGITTLADLKARVATDLEDRFGNQLVLNYYCEGGYNDTTPEAIIIMSADGKVERVGDANQIMWRLKDGEWAYHTIGSVNNGDAGTSMSASFDVYVPELNDAASTSVLLHYNEVSGAPSGGKGLYKAETNEYGRTTLQYITAFETLTSVDADAVLLKSEDTGKAGTVAAIRTLLAEKIGSSDHPMWTVTGLTTEAEDGTQLVYVKSVAKNLGDEFTLTKSDLDELGQNDILMVETSNYSEADITACIEDGNFVAKAQRATVGEVTIINVTDAYYTVPQGAVLYMADKTLEDGAQAGEFYVIDAPASSGLAAGERQFFRFNTEETYASYFYTGSAKDRPYMELGVYCYGWKDGVLMTTSSAGVRRGNSFSADPKSMLKKTAATSPSENPNSDFESLGSTNMWARCLGYHRVVDQVTVSGSTYTMNAGHRGCTSPSHHLNIWQCGSAAGGNINNHTSGLDITTAIIVDARNGGVLTAAQFKELASTDLVVDFLSVEQYNATTGAGKEIKYLVINDMAPMS